MAAAAERWGAARLLGVPAAAARARTRAAAWLRRVGPRVERLYRIRMARAYSATRERQFVQHKNRCAGEPRSPRRTTADAQTRAPVLPEGPTRGARCRRAVEPAWHRCCCAALLRSRAKGGPTQRYRAAAGVTAVRRCAGSYVALREAAEASSGLAHLPNSQNARCSWNLPHRRKPARSGANAAQ
jgi:hypothetical protein